MEYAKKAAFILAVLYVGLQIPVVGPMLRAAAQKPTA